MKAPFFTGKPYLGSGKSRCPGENALSLLSRIDSGTCYEDPSRFPHFSRSPVNLCMEEKHPFSTGNPYLGHEYPIARSLKEGADYSPDWRAKFTENYIRQITQAKDPTAELAEVLRQQRDGFIRELVQFHCHVPFPTQLSLERAIRFHRVARTARAIEAMVIADQSMKEIAHIVSATIETIEYFEKLFFDVRPFLNNKLWVRNLCYGENGNRLLQLALEGGWDGLSEVLLRDGPKSPRNLQRSASILHRRFQDYVYGLEENNVPVSEKDFDRLNRVCHLSASGALPSLDDPPPAELKDPTVPPSVADLTPAGRERVAALLNMVLQKAAEKSGAFDADKEKDIAPNCHKKHNGQTVKDQSNGAKQ